MNFTDEEYQNALGYVAGLFTLGGLSECGKTTAGYRFQELGVRKSKIIHIEYDMMRARGIDPEKGLTPDDFENLYKNDSEKAFKEFLFRLIGKMKGEGHRFASLESLYRAPFGAFIKRELGTKAANIYIDAPLEVRAARELLKMNAKAAETGEDLISSEEMIERIREKDQFKMERKATDVKGIADYVVDNSGSVTKEAFIAQIDAIARTMGVSM